MRLEIRYRSMFEYESFVTESQNELRACPTSDDYQELIGYRVGVSPAAKISSFVDYWGTRVDAFGHREPHSSLEVVATATVETKPRPLPSGISRSVLLDDPPFVDRHAEFLERTPHCDWGDELASLAAQHVALAGDDVVSRVLALQRLVGARMQYRKGVTSIGMPIDDVLAGGVGVCQDYAHLAIALCRSVGIPARYVSGYLFTRDETTLVDPMPDDDEALRVLTHAWFEAAIPLWGWLALDPTNQTIVGERHVKIGHGRDYDDVRPLCGVYSGAAEGRVTPTVEMRRRTGASAVSEPARRLQQAAQQQ